jgi:hypothetical protein
MKVGDLIRYKQPSSEKSTYGDDSLIGIVIYAEKDGYTIEVEWNDGERHVYFREHRAYLEVVCK